MSGLIDFIFSPEAVRERTGQLYDLALKGQGHFQVYEERLPEVARFVVEVIRDNYPDLKIPYHSRWGHFKAGNPQRLDSFYNELRTNSTADELETARVEFDLVITSVLLDAGAGATWTFKESDGRVTGRSEGLAIASLYAFLNGDFSSNSKIKLVADVDGLRSFSAESLRRSFQINSENPLVGEEGRVELIRALGSAVGAKPEYFVGGRPGGLVDFLLKTHGRKFPAKEILRSVLFSMNEIWPGRLRRDGVSLGDVWTHSLLGDDSNIGNEGGNLVPIHKLSQWLTYSLIEPLERAGFEITELDGLTGLAEYRNGGLFLDKKVIEVKDPSLLQTEHAPDSEIIIEWRALTLQLLDRIADPVRKELGLSAQEFPLAKVLEGGTWWAGRRIAKELRADAGPPLKLKSDGTVF